MLAIESRYEVAYRIKQNTKNQIAVIKPHKVAEVLIKPMFRKNSWSNVGNPSQKRYATTSAVKRQNKAKNVATEFCLKQLTTQNVK